MKLCWRFRLYISPMMRFSLGERKQSLALMVEEVFDQQATELSRCHVAKKAFTNDWNCVSRLRRCYCKIYFTWSWSDTKQAEILHYFSDLLLLHFNSYKLNCKRWLTPANADDVTKMVSHSTILAEAFLTAGSPNKAKSAASNTELWHYMLQMGKNKKHFMKKNLQKKDQWLRTTLAQVINEPTKRKKRQITSWRFLLNRITIIVNVFFFLCLPIDKKLG